MAPIVKKQDLVAFDRASARILDQDGHLHVKRTPISKANICEYWGEEIPEAEELGLRPDRIYKLLRDPGELAKAADSFNNKPLLFVHKAVTARDHAHLITVGTISNPEFEHPYLYADLACWDGKAIDEIENESRKELSSSYRYKAVMTPGTFEGQAYDGSMTQIFGNHVSLVPKGRAGRDVYVFDHALRRPITFRPFVGRFSPFK